MDWFCYNLIILIKWCKIPYKNLGKALFFTKSQGFCLKIWKLWWVFCLKIWKLWRVFCLKIWKLWQALTALQFNIFCWNFAHVSYLPMFTKVSVEFFSFCLDLELFGKIKRPGFYSLVFYIFINNSRSKQS